MKNITKIVTITVLLVFASCGESKKDNKENTPSISVIIDSPTVDNSQIFIASGKIEAIQNADISTRLMGHVDKIYVKVGEKVKNGQLLLSINSSDILAKKAQINASISEAEASFFITEKDFKRFKILFEQNSASQKELDDITVNYKMSKARLESAKQMKNQISAQLKYLNIIAPFDGIITGKYINAGDIANPGMPLISVESPGYYQVMTMIPETEISNIINGETVAVKIKSSERSINGTITEISTSTKNTGSQYLVKIVLDKTDEKILSGMFVSVQFDIKDKDKSSRILIPASAVVYRGELSGVYVIGNNNTTLLRWLRLGKKYEDKIEVLSGLSKDEEFVLSSESKIVNGSKINF